MLKSNKIGEEKSKRKRKDEAAFYKMQGESKETESFKGESMATVI